MMSSTLPAVGAGAKSALRPARPARPAGSTQQRQRRSLLCSASARCRAADGPTGSDLGARIAAGMACSLISLASLAPPADAALAKLSRQQPIYDGANILSEAKQRALSERLQAFEE